MGLIWEDPDKRRSPMDSGNNGTLIGKLAKAIAEKLAGKKKQG